jgi:hypothetical protein
LRAVPVGVSRRIVALPLRLKDPSWPTVLPISGIHWYVYDTSTFTGSPLFVVPFGKLMQTLAFVARSLVSAWSLM